MLCHFMYTPLALDQILTSVNQSHTTGRGATQAKNKPGTGPLKISYRFTHFCITLLVPVIAL